MANIKSFPNNQDVYIGAEDVMKWLHGRTSGVFAADGNASVSALAGSAMAVTVSDGLGWMANAGKDGVVWWIDHEAVNGTKLQLNIDPADGVLNRIDRIVVEWQTTNYVDYPEVKVLKGNFASNATAPALTNNSTVRQISLAKIRIAAGTTAITSSMITDERLDSSVCGLVTESISIDTSTMQKQFESLLTAIQTELKDLNEDTAALMKAGGTMYGALNMGANKIQNVALPTDDGDAVNKKFLDDTLANFESGISMDLLWENGNYSSSFIAQTIAIDGVGDYSRYQILVFLTGGAAQAIIANEEGRSTRLFVFALTKGNNQIIRNVRNITVNSGKIDFADNLALLPGASTTVDNNALKPYRVYGIKGATT